MKNVLSFPTKFFAVTGQQSPPEQIAMFTLSILNQFYQDGQTCDPAQVYDEVQKKYLDVRGRELCAR